MTNQELVAFVRDGLSKHRSESEITNDLIKGGWNEADIKEAFLTVQPPVSAGAPALSETPGPVSPQPQDPSKNKRYVLGGMLFCLVSISFLTKIIFDSTFTSSLGEFTKIIIPIILVLVLATYLVETIILNKVTKKYNGVNPSWQKAFFVVGLWSALNSLWAEIQPLLHLPWAVSIIISVIVLVIQIILLMVMYDFRPLKAFLISLVAGLIAFAIVLGPIAIIGITASVLDTSIQVAKQKALGTAGAEPSDLAASKTFYEQGVADTQQNQFAKAIDDFTQAIAAVPNDGGQNNPLLADMYLLRSYAKAGSGDVAGAIADTTKSISLDPTAKEAYVGRAGYYLAQSNTTSAIPDLNAALALDPQDTQQPNNGVVYLFRAAAEAATSKKSVTCADFSNIKTSDTSAFTPSQNSLYKQLQTGCK